MPKSWLVRGAESAAHSGPEDMSPANRDAVALLARFLRLANNMGSEAEVPGFAELARMVGENKGPHNDQR